MPRMAPGKPTGGGDEALPAGVYIVALRSFSRKTSKAGNEYLRCRFVVCTGPAKGRGFFTNMGLDFSKEGTRNRWLIWMEACDVNEEFEIGSEAEGTVEEGDENLKRLFVDQPFKITLKVETNGQYRNNDIQLIHFKRNWTQADYEAISQWLSERESRGDDAGGGGGGGGPVGDGGSGGGPVDDDYYDNRAGGTKAGGYAGDDDIPF